MNNWPNDPKAEGFIYRTLTKALHFLTRFPYEVYPDQYVKRVPANSTVPECHPTLSAAWTRSRPRGMGTFWGLGFGFRVSGLRVRVPAPKQSTAQLGVSD